jgi:PKHD-type hydroxylase
LEKLSCGLFDFYLKGKSKSMILEIPEFLSRREIRSLQQIARESSFVDGKITNPHNKTKNNEQIDASTSGHQQASQLMMEALGRHEGFRDFTMPRRVAPPLLCRYDEGMSYGTHCDVSFIQLKQPPNMRSDISATIFLADPSTYDGGELILHLENRKVPIKLHAGGLVAYPSTTLHEVAEVTRGQRLVAITFIESQIIDERQRHMIYSLGEVSALEGLTMKPENRNRLDQVRHNLIRMWS